MGAVVVWGGWRGGIASAGGSPNLGLGYSEVQWFDRRIARSALDVMSVGLRGGGRGIARWWNY